MQTSTPNYDDAIIADSREILLKAEAKIIDLDTSVKFASSNDEFKYCNIKQIYDEEIKQPDKFVTLEDDRTLLDGKFKFYFEDQDWSQEYCYVSDTISDSQGYFHDTAEKYKPFLRFELDGIQKLKELSIYFSETPTDGVIKSMSYEFYDKTAELLAEGTLENLEGKTKYTLKNLNLINPGRMEFKINQTSLPYRRARITEIVFGDIERWNGDNIAKLSIKHRGDPSNLKTPYGTCEIVIDNQDRKFDPRNKEGIFEMIEAKQGISVYLGARLRDRSVEYHSVGTYYQHKDGWKTSENGLTIKWSLVDIMGLLADKEYKFEASLMTFEDWVKTILARLGKKFENKYEIISIEKNQKLTPVFKEYVEGKKCSELLKDIAMVTNTWLHVEPSTGKIVFENLPSSGKAVTLDNMNTFPVISPNENCSEIIFNLYNGINYDTKKEKYPVIGNDVNSSRTITIDNPFIQTPVKAESVAKNILATMGGNKIQVTGRGDMCSEVGDLDHIWLDKSTAASGRRIEQEFTLNDGALKNVKSVFISPDAVADWAHHIHVTVPEYIWKVPAGTKQIKLILIGGGTDGTDGTDGTYEKAGEDGKDGLGGKVWEGVINVEGSPYVTIKITDMVTTADVDFRGAYSSENGKNYNTGYAVLSMVYARPGMLYVYATSGDGGKGGKGGNKGIKGSKNKPEVLPGKGTQGIKGASGRAYIFWNN